MSGFIRSKLGEFKKGLDLDDGWDLKMKSDWIGSGWIGWN
jgi:hypothetical protein